MTEDSVLDDPAYGRAAAMAAATFVGAIAATLGYWAGGDIGAAAVTVVLLVIIAETRHRAREANAGTVSVFGAFDGLTSEIAVLAGQIVAHQPLSTVLSVGGGLAAGAAVSMGLGEWLGDVYGVKRWVALVQTFATAAVAIAAGVVVSVFLGAVG